MRESDLYLPIKRYLESQGYEVKGEVRDCDILAVRPGEHPVVVELKLTLGLTLLMQGTERLALTDKVYLGVPGTLQVLRKQRKRLLRLLRMLGLGLIAVRGQRVEVLLDPKPYRGRRISNPRQQRLLLEFEQRVGDPNLGGSSTRRGRVTAFRQRALAIAKHLGRHGPSKASDVAQQVGDAKARQVLYRNVYGWFERVERGVYDLSPRGRREVSEGGDPSPPRT